MNNLRVPLIAARSLILEPQRTVLLQNRGGIVIDDRDPLRGTDLAGGKVVVEHDSLSARILQGDAVDGPAAATLQCGGFQKNLKPLRRTF